MPDIDTGTLYLWEWTQTIFVLLLMVLLISHSFLIPTNTSSPSPARWTMPNAISFDADFWRMHLWIANVPGYKKRSKKQALKDKQVFWRNGTGNWVFQPRLQILHRILAPHLLHWPKVQSTGICWIWHISQHKQFWKYHLDKVGKNFRLASADWKCSGCNSTTKGSLCSAKLESLENKLKECAHPNDLEKVSIEDHLPSTTKIEWQNIKVLTGFAWWRRLERVAKEFPDFLRCAS